MNRTRLISTILALLFSCTYPQMLSGFPLSTPTYEALSGDTLETLWALYRGMEINRSAHDPFKNRWKITNGETCGYILDRLIGNQAEMSTMTKNHWPAHSSLILKLTQDIQERKAFFICTKRWDDDEIESLRIDPNADSLDEVWDRVFIRKVLGEELYEKVKEERGIDLTIPDHLFDIRFHVAEPEVMFYSTPSPLGTGRWFVSAFAKLGNDNINLPIWFKSSIVGGFRLRHTVGLLSDGRELNTWNICVGLEQPIEFSVPQGSILETMFKQRRLIGSSYGIYFRATFNSDSVLGRANCEYGAEGSLAIVKNEKNAYGSDTPMEFHTISNYLAVLAKLNQIGGLLDVGGGISWHDLDYVSRISGDVLLRKLEPTRYNWIPFVEAGISQSGGLLPFSLGAQVNYNISRGYGYLVFKSSVMVTNNFGIDFRYFASLNTGNLPPWQYGNYIVFSPIIRINY